MKDFLGKEIEVGDKIVVAEGHGRNAGASLARAIVLGFTKAYVVIEGITRWLYREERRVKPEKIVVISRVIKLIGTGQPPANSQAVREAEEALRSKKS